MAKTQKRKNAKKEGERKRKMKKKEARDRRERKRGKTIFLYNQWAPVSLVGPQWALVGPLMGPGGALYAPLKDLLTQP